MSKHIITATLYDKKGRSLATAQNNYMRTHPIQAKFASQAKQPIRVFLHAEIAALVKLKKGQIPHKIHIARTKKDGTPGLAAPCPVCRAALAYWGVKHISYTTSL
jgi:tRNA(Arg) A34 adenosine deaminase TadA